MKRTGLRSVARINLSVLFFPVAMFVLTAFDALESIMETDYRNNDLKVPVATAVEETPLDDRPSFI